VRHGGPLPQKNILLSATKDKDYLANIAIRKRCGKLRVPNCEDVKQTVQQRFTEDFAAGKKFRFG
jgi:hypothetical protein